MQRKSLELPDETRTIPNGRTDIWNLGDFVVGRIRFEPGWRWSTDVKPIAGTDWCEYHHLGLIMEGTLHYVTPEGLEMEVSSMNSSSLKPLRTSRLSPGCSRARAA